MIEAVAPALEGDLPRVSRPRRIAVVGAGISGLVAASLLEEAGHHVVVLEARDEAGGRIRTLTNFFGPGQSAELGAMRIPAGHTRTGRLVRSLGLALRPFSGHPQDDLLVVHDVARRVEYERIPDVLGATLPVDERDRPVSRLLAEAVGPLLDDVRRDAANLPLRGPVVARRPDPMLTCRCAGNLNPPWILGQLRIRADEPLTTCRGPPEP